MKKALFALTVLLVFTLAGCDMFGGDEETNIPVLQVIGDMDVTIGLNEEYVDPGVTLLGDFDLDITTESTLDNTTYGIYYIYYSVNFDEQTYTAERRIRVVRDTEKAFNIDLEVVSTDPNALTFSVFINDEEGKLLDGKGTLYLLDEKIGEYPIENGLNVLEFTGLANMTYYRFEFTGSYIEGGVTYNLVDYNTGAKTTFIPPEDYPRLELVGDDELHLEVGEAYVEQGVTIIGEQQDLEVSINSNVNVNAPGTYVVIYTIVFNETTIYAHRTVIVEGEELPFDIEFEVSEINAYSIIVTVTVDDPDGVITDPVGALYLGDDLVSSYVYADGVTEMIFSNLLADTTYNFVLEGSYLSEGSSVSIGDYTQEITTQTVSNIQPLLTLIGDSEMNVDLNTVFVDPGAQVIGDPYAIIETVSNVETSVPGEYYVTYSTTINGEHYSVERTVNVINPDLLDFGVSLSLVGTTESSITFSLDVTSNFDQLTSHVAKLYKGALLVSEQQFGDGNTVLEFTGLLPETEYTVVIVGDYMSNGILESIGDFSLNATTMDASAPSVNLDSYEIDYRSLDSVITVNDEHSQITSIKAAIYETEYEDDYLEGTWDLTNGVNTHSYTELYYATSYKLVVEYTYIPFGESTPIVVSVTLLEFDTLSPDTPSADSLDCDISDTFITCNAEWDTDGFTMVGFFAQIWHGGSYTDVVWFTNDGSTLFVEDLDPETDYILKIFADYYVDATGERYIMPITNVSAITLRPIVRSVPIIDNIVYSYTETTVTVDFDILDETNAFTSGFLRLRSSYGVVEDVPYVVGHNTFTFDTGVEANRDYYLEFRMSYDLNETYPYVDYLMTSISFTTPAIVEVDAFVPKEMTFSDDHLILQIDLSNDDEMNIDFVTIDGVRYETYAFPSNLERIYIDMGIRTAGTYHFNLDNVGTTVNDVEFIYDLDTEAVVEVYVPGTIAPDDATVKVIDITTDPVGGSPFVLITGDGGNSTEDTYVYVHLENEFNLDVTALSVYNGIGDVTDYEVLSPTLIKVPIIVGNGEYVLGLSYIEFTRNGETIHETLDVPYFGSAYGYDADEMTYVYTLADLQAMTPDGHYRLMNDIDLGGVNWTPLGTQADPFGGSFDGNGFTLSNFTINQNIGVGENYAYIGFYGYSGVYVSDLTFHNVSINVTTDEEDVAVSAGILAGWQQSYSVQNVHVTGLSSITVNGIYKGQIGGLIGEYYEGWMSVVKDSSAYVDITVNAVYLEEQNYSLSVGGLIGFDNSGNIAHSHSTGSITITNTGWQYVYAGGLVGYIYGPTDSVDKGTYIFNSYSEVNIDSSVKNYYGATGGLLGSGYSVGAATILINTFATGDINAVVGNTSGLVGINYGYIYNSFSTGDVNATNGKVAAIYANNSFSWNSNPAMVNVYNWEDQVITKSYEPVNGNDYYIKQIIDVPTSELNKVEFYTDILGFNEYFFDFSDLNVVTGDLPTS